MTTLQDVVANLSEQLATREAKAALRHSLRDRSIVSTTVNLGGAARGKSAETDDELRRAPAAAFQPEMVSESLDDTGNRIRDLYVNRRKRSNVVLWTSLAGAGLMVIAGLVIVLLAVLNGHDPSWVEVISVGVPALFSGTFLAIYKLENDQLQRIEHDLRSVEQIDRLLDLANSVEDEQIRAKMYDKIVDLVVGPA